MSTRFPAPPKSWKKTEPEKVQKKAEEVPPAIKFSPAIKFLGVNVITTGMSGFTTYYYDEMSKLSQPGLNPRPSTPICRHGMPKGVCKDKKCRL